MSMLYLECYAGISGDMAVAALLDLGADEEVLKKALDSLPLKDFEVKISRVKKSGLDVCDFNVILNKNHENHDHDMNYLYGKKEVHTHGHHRSLQDVYSIIDEADITDKANRTAKKIFRILAEAEAEAHGTLLEEVHFHEVGAVDSIVDIISAAVCLDNLKITDAVVSELYEGKGFIRCQHGLIPIPAPAVSNIAAKCGLKLHITDEEGEHVTPTGAAIAAAVKTSDKLPPNFSIEKIGMGGGKRVTEMSGILRAMIIREGNKTNNICKLECNIDDCSGEVFGYVMEKLFEAGAKDVHYVPVYMKKNRPAYLLNVICSEDDVPRIEKIVFAETTTIGIRRVGMESTKMKYENMEIDAPFGKVSIKICEYDDIRKIYPEYESVMEICEKSGISYSEAYRKIKEYAESSAPISANRLNNS